MQPGSRASVLNLYMLDCLPKGKESFLGTKSKMFSSYLGILSDSPDVFISLEKMSDLD